MTDLYKRNRKRWTVNECLELQREFELLEWSIDEIAIKHKRTPNAIMNKLDKEGFANYMELSKEYYKSNMQLTSGNNDTTLNTNTNTSTNTSTSTNTNTNLNTILTEEKEYKTENHYNELKNHIIQLEKQISTLTELFIMQHKNKNKTTNSMLSLFE